MKPHKSAITEIFGISSNAFAQSCIKRQPKIPLNTTIKSIFSNYLKNKTWCIDFMLKDDKSQDGKYFIIQIHANSTVQPLNFNKIYIYK